MRILILAALAANLGSPVFANEGDQIAKRSFSSEGRRWVALFHDGQGVEHVGSIVSHVTTIRGKEFFEVLRNDDHDLTRWTVDLGATSGFGRVQSISASPPSNLQVESFTPWVDVEVHPEPPITDDKSKLGWNDETTAQGWRARAKPAYEESFTLALAERTILQPNRPARAEVVRVQKYYRQRVRQNRLSMVLAGPDGDDGTYKKLFVERNGVEGEIDLKFTNAIGEIIGFSASGDQTKVFVTTTGLARYTFDVSQVGSKLVFQMRGFSDEIREGLLARPASRSAKIQMVDRAAESASATCGAVLVEPAMAAE